MEKLTMTKKEFKIIMEVLPKVAQDDVRPILQGVCFTNNEVVAIDGYRLSKRLLNDSLQGEYTILGKDLKEVVKACKRNIEHIEIIFKDNAIITLYDKENELVSYFNFKLLDCKFVAYKSLLLREFTDSIDINSKDILDLIKSLKKNTPISLELIGEKINVYEMQYKGTYKNEKTILNYLGDINLKKKISDSLLIACNSTCLKEALKGFKDIKLSYIDKVSPFVIEDITRYEMILPIRWFAGELEKVS